MKRKLIRQGKNALTVTLPAKWAENHRLKAGDEIDIDEKPYIIEIRPASEIREKVVRKIDVEGYMDYLNVAIGSIYRSGADEISVEYSDPAAIEIANKLIEKQLIGFELVSQTGKGFRIKSLTELSEGSLDDMLKRLYETILALSQNTSDGLSRKDSAMLENAYYMDRTVNKTMNFILRLINKSRPGNISSSHTLYSLVRQLEELADHYRDLSLHFAKKPQDVDHKILEALRKSSGMIEKIWLLTFSFSKSEADKTIKEIKKMREDMKEEFSKKQIRDAHVFLFMILETLKAVCIKVFDLNISKDQIK